MIARTRRTIAAVGSAALILGVTGIAATGTANAADTCQSAAWGGNAGNEAAMCSSAWKITNMSLLSNRGVINAGYEYCNIKARYGATRAASEIKGRYGLTKGAAINKSAESWLC